MYTSIQPSWRKRLTSPRDPLLDRYLVRSPLIQSALTLSIYTRHASAMSDLYAFFPQTHLILLIGLLWEVSSTFCQHNQRSLKALNPSHCASLLDLHNIKNGLWEDSKRQPQVIVHNQNKYIIEGIFLFFILVIRRRKVTYSMCF